MGMELTKITNIAEQQQIVIKDKKIIDILLLQNLS